MSTAEETRRDEPRVRHKTFSYGTALEWTSGRSGVVRAEGRPELSVSSPPEFRGEAGRWTPEEMLVGAIDLCTMTTFAAFSQRLKLPIVAYSSEAEGLLEFVDDGYQFTRIVLRPRISIADAEAEPRTRQAIHDAHAACLLSRPVRAAVVIEPRIQVTGAAV